jgi:hypothetical protein
VDSANSVSPSVMVCTGSMVRARPSCAICDILAASALVSTASVAMMPSVVEDAGSMSRGVSPLRIACVAWISARPSSVRAPAMGRPQAGSMTSPTALTATMAPTVNPLTASAAVPMPPFIARSMPNSLPTTAPAPAPTLPSTGGALLAASQAA